MEYLKLTVMMIVLCSSDFVVIGRQLVLNMYIGSRCSNAIGFGSKIIRYYCSCILNIIESLKIGKGSDFFYSSQLHLLSPCNTLSH